MSTPDAIVVGSGPGGVNAAAALVGAGRSVVMLDYGDDDRRYGSLIPDRSFLELRREDRGQHRYLLGEEFEGVRLGQVRIGVQLTPPRAHVFCDPTVDPVVSSNFQGSSSLALGGFGAAWSAAVYPFSEDELRPMGLGMDDMRPHFDAVTRRIGVSGDRDDLERFLPVSPSMMPSLELDSNAERIYRNYERKRERLTRAGFFMGPARLAVCSEEYRGRGPEPYLDMAYWSDPSRAVYRPQWTVEELQREPGFRYLGRRHVRLFEEEGRRVRVHTSRADGGEPEVHEAGALVLAAGTLGTARIVLRSLDRYGARVPVLCNPYTYVPMLNWGGVGKPVRDRRHSLPQLAAMARARDGSDRLVQAQIISYRSLLTFKLVQQSRLSHRENLRVMRALMPYLVILGIHHEDHPTSRKAAWLERGADGSADHLHIEYGADAEEKRRQNADVRFVLSVFFRLGCLPLLVLHPGDGANIHFAGSFPMGPDGGDLSCDRDGRLRATRSVYLADGSVFPRLPSKGLTFTLMANADRVGTLLAAKLR